MKSKLPYLIGFMTLWFSNLGLSQYTIPVMGNNNCTHGDFITAVVIGEIRNTNSACSGYGDYTDQHTTLTAGSEHTIAITINSEYNEAVGVFIDWNQDFDFSDEGEFFSNGYVTVSGETEFLSIQVPSDAKPGKTRMRVVCQYGSPITKENSNRTVSSFGEYEDYSLEIQNSSLTNLVPGNGTGNPEQVLLEVYPNPTAKTVEVYTNLRSAHFALTDPKGTIVRKGALESGMTIDLAEFHPGVYAFTVNYQDKTLVKRIVKQ